MLVASDNRWCGTSSMPRSHVSDKRTWRSSRWSCLLNAATTFTVSLPFSFTNIVNRDLRSTSVTIGVSRPAFYLWRQKYGRARRAGAPREYQTLYNTVRRQDAHGRLTPAEFADTCSHPKTNSLIHPAPTKQLDLRWGESRIHYLTVL